MMEYLLKLWDAFDGRKTALGLLIEALTTLAQQTPEIIGAFGGDSIATTQVVGRLLIVLGAAHRIVKGA